MKRSEKRRRLALKILLMEIGLLFLPEMAKGQHLGAGTNLFWWGTTTPNLSVEVALSRKLTIDLSGSYNSWTFWKNEMTLRHYLFQPELRYWLCRSFEGHFFGLHGHYAHYNVGQIPFIPGMEDFTYRGDLYGGGLSYGYHFDLGKCWGLELSLGVGYTYLEYNKYICTECAELVGRYKRHFVGPTRVGITFIYMIR